MEQDNNILNLFNKISGILNNKPSPPSPKPPQNRPHPLDNATLKFISEHEKRKNNIINKNK